MTPLAWYNRGTKILRKGRIANRRKSRLLKFISWKSRYYNTDFCSRLSPFCPAKLHVELDHGKGTNVELDVVTAEDIDEVTDKKIKASRPKYKDGTLYFPDGTKSGELEDDDQYLYDLARGK